MSQSHVRIMHYAPIWQVKDWLNLGWVIVRAHCSIPHHDSYNITVEWLCDCPIPVPLAPSIG